ncbi:MAG: hypothetical protein QOF98_8, partial [Streptomyces sp.]|nr:hypothetical protein [Streptomyces sp.]
MGDATIPASGFSGTKPAFEADRSVDLAALHASPAVLAIRDRLLIGLAFASGSFEAICFLSFGKIFSAFQTGNVVLLGVGLAGTRPPFGPDWVRVVISLVSFAAGAALATRMLARFDGDEEVEDADITVAWPRRVSIVLSVVLVLQVAFLVVWMATSPSSGVSNTLMALNALGMGAQMNAIRSMHVPGVSTTAATATFISLVTGASNGTMNWPVLRRLGGVLIAMSLG